MVIAVVVVVGYVTCEKTFLRESEHEDDWRWKFEGGGAQRV